MKSPLFLHGMHGLGDNVRQRAIVRQLLERHEVWLESTWVSIYHDLLGDGLHVIRKESPLRTQKKNAQREAALFSRSQPPMHAKHVRVWYKPEEVRARGSVMAAMCVATATDAARADFRLPVPAAWLAKLTPWLRAWGYDGSRPIMLYRPLVDRPKDWGGCEARNPDHAAYAALFKAIRQQFFVVSVADLKPDYEWIVGERVETDARAHAGELEFEALAALTAMAGMVFCSPGFAAVLAHAVGAPVACIFGGYERSAFFFAGAKDAPVLAVDPINPVDDFRHDTRCDKRIDLGAAIPRLRAFAAEAAGRTAVAA